MNGEFAFKEIILVSYRTTIQKLVKSSENIQIEDTPKAHNRHVDALPTLASNIDVSRKDINVSITKRTLRTTMVEVILAPITD